MQPLRTHRITIKKDIIGHLKVCRDIIAHADLTSFNGIKQNNQSPYFLASLVFFITMPVSAVGAAIDALFALVLPQDNFIRLTLKYLVRLVVGLTYLSISILSSCLLLLLSIPDLFLIGVDVVLCLGLYVIALIVVPCLVHLVLSVLLCLAVVLTAVAWVCSSSILFFLPAITCGPLFVLTVYTHPVVLVVAIPLSILFLFLTCELFADNEALWIFPISLYLILGLCIGGGVALGLLMPLSYAVFYVVLLVTIIIFDILKPSSFVCWSAIDLELDLSDNPRITALKDLFTFQMLTCLIAPKPSQKAPLLEPSYQPVELKDIYRSNLVDLAFETIYQGVYQPIKSATLITCSHQDNDNLDDAYNKVG